MNLIEQAIFTSAKTDLMDGYHVVAASPGVCEADHRELAAWGPSHDALSDSAPNSVSFNFHPLPSGAYCVSRTSPSGWEYSGRGGARVYTQNLIVSPETLARFANNPFALLRAALVNGSLRVFDKVPKKLTPIRLLGHASVVNLPLLQQLGKNPGVEWIAAICQETIDSVSVAIDGGPPSEHVIAGLINLIPINCRPDFTFSTGLKFSSRRPYRIVSLSGDREERQRVDRGYRVKMLDLSKANPTVDAICGDWGRMVYRVLSSGRASFLAEHLAQLPDDLTLDDLPTFGRQLLGEFEDQFASCDEEGGSSAESLSPWFGSHDNPDANQPGFLSGDDLEEGTSSWQPEEEPPRNPEVQHAHEAHTPFMGSASVSPIASMKASAPSHQLGHDNSEMLEQLERLDDLVFESISGQQGALAELQSYWPTVRDGLAPDMVDESRAQYLRYALSLWEAASQESPDSSSETAIRAIDVLSLLFTEA